MICFRLFFFFWEKIFIDEKLKNNFFKKNKIIIIKLRYHLGFIWYKTKVNR